MPVRQAHFRSVGAVREHLEKKAEQLRREVLNVPDWDAFLAMRARYQQVAELIDDLHNETVDDEREK